MGSTKSCGGIWEASRATATVEYAGRESRSLPPAIDSDALDAKGIWKASRAE
jgi:hypothetical protein